jgi:hypothetical protein
MSRLIGVTSVMIKLADEYVLSKRSWAAKGRSAKPWKGCWKRERKS